MQQTQKMEDLGPFVCRFLSGLLSRPDCVYLSWLSKEMNTLFKDLCNPRLTSAQLGAIKQLQRMNLFNWHGMGFPSDRARKFPSSFSLASGTSTGKTLVALKLASDLFRQGKRVMLVVPHLLSAQWLAEHEKFAFQMDLVPLQLVDNLSSVPSRTRIPLVFKHYPEQRTSNKFAAWRFKWLQAAKWDVVIFDEGASVPQWMRTLPNTYAFTLNASAETSNTVVNYARDVDLGKLPSIEFCVYSESVRRRYGHPAECDIVATTRRYIDQLVDPTKKTLVVTMDRFHSIVPESQNTSRKIIDCKKFSHPKITHTIKKSGSLAENSDRIQSFASSTGPGALMVPVRTVARGHNIPCQAMVIFDLDESLGDKLLMQLIGRVVRVQTGIKQVTIHVITASTVRWKQLTVYGCDANSELNQQVLRLGDADTFIAAGMPIKVDTLFDSIPRYRFRPQGTNWQPPVQPPPLQDPIQVFPPTPDFTVLGDYSVHLRDEYGDLVVQVIVRNYRTPEAIGKKGYGFRSFYWSGTTAGLENVAWCNDRAEAVGLFKLRFIDDTRNAWEGRARFAPQPHFRYIVSYYPPAPEQCLGLAPHLRLASNDDKDSLQAPKRLKLDFNSQEY